MRVEVVKKERSQNVEKGFRLAGDIWHIVWTVMGLTCLTVSNGKARVSTVKVIYSILIIILLSWASYNRAINYVRNFSNTISFFIDSFTTCYSLVGTTLLLLLTLISQSKASHLLTETLNFSKKYSIKMVGSFTFYFPYSCFVPFVSAFTDFNFFSNSFTLSKSLSLFESNIFPIYSFVFYGQMYYYIITIEVALRHVRENIKDLEMSPKLDNIFCLSDFRSIVRVEEDPFIKKLNDIRKMYHSLVVISRKMDDIFAGRIILLIFHNFIAGVLFTFNGILELVNPTVNPVPYWELMFFWATCCFYGLFFVVRPCERVHREIQRIINVVQSLSTTPGYTVGFYDELRHFALAFALNKNEFSPHNVLTLNNPMLLSAFGAITSSLAILLQLTLGSQVQ